MKKYKAEYIIFYDEDKDTPYTSTAMDLVNIEDENDRIFAADGELETLRTQLTEAGVPISGSGG
jgi:hypothetical protein